MIHRLLVAALAALPLIAAEPGVVPPTLPATVAATTGTGAALGLEEAIRLALQRNETVAIARARMDRAEANRRASVAALLPQLSAFGTYGNTSQTTGGPWSAEPSKNVTGELRLELLLAARLTLSDLLAGPEGDRPIAVPAPALLPSREPVVLVDLARRTRADLKATDLRRQAATEQRRSALNSGYYPKLGARLSYFDQELSGANAYEQDPSWQAALVASWSLYDGGANYALADVSEAEAREFAATLGAQGRGLVRDLGTAVAALGAAEAGLAQARSGMEFALSNRDAVTAKAQQGLATPLEQADANASVFDAERSLVLAQNTLLLAHFNIRSLVGWWPLGERQPE